MRVVLACAVEPPASADLDTVEGHAWADARRQLDEISAGRANGAASDTVLTKPTPLGLLLIDDDEFVLDCFLVLAKHSHPLWQVRRAPDHAAGLGIAREFMPHVISTGVGYAQAGLVVRAKHPPGQAAQEHFLDCRHRVRRIFDG